MILFVNANCMLYLNRASVMTNKTSRLRAIIICHPRTIGRGSHQNLPCSELRQRNRSRERDRSPWNPSRILRWEVE